MKDIKETGGYRLQYAEIYNWGTFDKSIWRLNTNGKNSLLTGSNGSGKTTLVDAIITLLVPPGKRHYNQSSGAESKRERNEKTYALGAYVRVQSESGLAAKTKYLRTKDDFSILLGTFYNQVTKDYLTLLQVRWFSNNDLRKSYFVIPTALTIEEHLTPLDTGGVWRKNLKKKSKAEEFDSFSKYSQAFSRKFGLKSEKALTLFAQTVGIKVLGNLNEFIRTNMLEEHDVESDFVELREHYENLLSSHRAIEKAKEQVGLLQPIIENGKEYHLLKEKTAQLTDLQAATAPFFANKKVKLLEESTKSLQADLDKKASQVADIRLDLEQLTQQKTDIQIAISTNQIYEQIQNLDKQIQQADREQEQRQNRANRYNNLASQLDLKTDPNERLFYKNLEESKKQIAAANEETDRLQTKEVAVQVQLKEKETEIQLLEDRLASLQTRKNRIPIEQIKIREDLLKKLNLSEADLPFAAELMKVKDDVKIWETAIEQALRPLSLSLLVPEKHYEFVLNSVSRVTLNGQIFFRKISDSPPLQMAKPGKNSLSNKVEVQKNHPYTAWLEDILARDFDFEVVKGYTTIASFSKSLNEKGLIKNRALHQRDDRPKSERHILGWDNRETILALQREISFHKEEQKHLINTLRTFQNQRQEFFETRDLWTRLSSFEQYGEIDWKTLAKNSKQYKTEKEKLLSSSNQLQELEEQMQQLKSQITNGENNRERLITQRGNLENRLENYTKELEETKHLLEIQPVRTNKFDKEIKTFFEGEKMVISSISRLENLVTKEVAQRLTAAERSAGTVERRLSLAMQKFINPPAEILEKYPNWTADTMDLQPDIAYLKEFELIFNKINQEDLPKYQKRFKDWLNERLIFDIANFKTSLDNKEVIIEESIQQINSSLLDINFNSNPLTYIQLDIHKTRDNAVRDFKEMLKDAMPDPAKLIQGDEVELEKSFKRIQKIIKELSNNENWRRKVTDVRNWLEFAAIERFRADDTERQYYMDSQSLSGGEKAKLAYTILASAIAYQFGIRNENSHKKSFRFAVVDEAFSKVDPENSIYAMELFKQLNLQLMVVTPLDKINLAEPYIHAVHFVQNKNKKNSEVFDLPMEVYKAQKKQFGNSGQ